MTSVYSYVSLVNYLVLGAHLGRVVFLLFVLPLVRCDGVFCWRVRGAVGVIVYLCVMGCAMVRGYGVLIRCGLRAWCSTCKFVC